MITLRNLITHSRIYIYHQDDIPTGNIVAYGEVLIYLGPGDNHHIRGIDILYQKDKKIVSIQPVKAGIGISKSLFDRDIAPVCYAAIDKIKETFGKLEYDTIYLVTENDAVKEPNKPKD
jgi:hypothetical protein